jgi:hypothetical protein
VTRCARNSPRSFAVCAPPAEPPGRRKTSTSSSHAGCDMAGTSRSPARFSALDADHRGGSRRQRATARRRRSESASGAVGGRDPTVNVVPLRPLTPTLSPKGRGRIEVVPPCPRPTVLRLRPPHICIRLQPASPCKPRRKHVRPPCCVTCRTATRRNGSSPCMWHRVCRRVSDRKPSSAPNDRR